MKRGHVVGTKKEKKGSTDWYKQIEEENIRKIEAAWAVKRGSKQRTARREKLLAALRSPTSSNARR